MELLLFEEGKCELYRSGSVPGFLQMNPQTSMLPLPATVLNTRKQAQWLPV